MTTHKNKKLSKKVGNVIFIALFALLCVALINVLVAKLQNREPTFFGYSLMYVQTGSMEPVIPEKTIILVKTLSKDEIKQIKKDDVIVYRNSGVINTITHRVVETHIPEGYVVTRGDANSVNDKNSVGEEKTSIDLIFAKYVCNLSVVSFLYGVLSSVWGFVLIIVVPSLILLGVYIVSIAKQSVALTEQKRAEQEQQAMQDLKNRAVQEYLKNQEIQKETMNADNAEVEKQNSEGDGE